MEKSKNTVIYSPFLILKSNINNIIALNLLNTPLLNIENIKYVAYSAKYVCLFLIEEDTKFFIIYLNPSTNEWFKKQKINDIILFNDEEKNIEDLNGVICPFYISNK